MKIFRNQRIGIILFSFVLCLAITTTVFAEEKTRYYIRVNGVSENVYGDFDGITGNLSPDTTPGDNPNETKRVYCIFPNLETATGGSITFGGRNGRLIGEFTYSLTKHDAKFEARPTSEAENERISFDVRYCLRDPDECNLIPFALIGVARNKIDVKNGAGYEITETDSTTDPPTVHPPSKTWGMDTTYTGTGYNLGLGVMLRLNDKLVLEGSYLINRVEFDRVSASDQTYNPRANADIRQINIGLNYYFN